MMNGKSVFSMIGRAILPILALIITLFELVKENEWADKADDLVYFGIAILATIWGVFFRNKTSRYFPIIFAVLAFATKLYALSVEGDDMRAVDPDYFVIALVVLMAIVNVIAEARMQKRKELSK